MARYDKYDSQVSGARAQIAADMVDVTKLNRAWGVGLDVNGRLVFGAGASGVVGILVLTRHVYAGDIVDYMDLGEVVEFDPTTAGTKAPAATVYYAAAADGAMSTTNTGKRVGVTIEAGRLRVHMTP